MTFDAAAHLRRALRSANWRSSDLWIASFAMGSNLDGDEIDQITSGRRAPSRLEYDVLAAALNDRFDDLGQERSVRYWNDFPANGP
jgi:hypothetical protein